MYLSNRCACYTNLNKLELALKDAQECVRLKPDWSKGYYRLGNALALLHRFDEAMAQLKKGAQVDPANADITNRLKEVEASLKADAAKRAKMGNISAAMAAKEEGNELYKNGKFPEAIDVYTRGLGLATTDEERIALLNNRAGCRFQERDFRQCVSDCSEVLAMDPKNTKALLRRGLAYENIEKIDAAMKDMKLLQEISPGIPQGERERERETARWVRC